MLKLFTEKLCDTTVMLLSILVAVRVAYDIENKFDWNGTPMILVAMAIAAIVFTVAYLITDKIAGWLTRLVFRSR